MVEITRVNLLEIGKNVFGDAITIRKLYFADTTKTITVGGTAIVLNTSAIDPSKIGESLEIKHPTDYTKYEVREIVDVSANTVTVSPALVNTYPIGSFVYTLTGDRDIIDTQVTDRVETDVMFVELEYRKED